MEQCNIYVETVIFTRPNSDKKEEGLRISRNDDFRSIIIDSDMNIVLNANYVAYNNDTNVYVLNSEIL